MPSTDIVIPAPDISTIKVEHSRIVQAAKDLVVNSKESHEAGLHLLVWITQSEKAVYKRMDPTVAHAYQAHKGMTDLRKDLLGNLNEAKLIANVEITGYEIDQRQIAEEASKDSPVEVEPAIADVEGVSSYIKYSVEVMDVVLLAAHVAENPEYARYLTGNVAEMGRDARAQRDEFLVPGCRLKKTVVRSVRTA